jgi:hypothetical protein
MLKIIILISSFIFLNASIILDQPLQQFSIKDQFGKIHQIQKNTKKVIFVFQKSTAKIVRDYLKSKPKDFLQQQKTIFVADVSDIPSFIKYFLLPIKGCDFPIVTLDNDKISKYYKDEKHIGDIVVVSLNRFKVIKIQYFSRAKNIFK